LAASYFLSRETYNNYLLRSRLLEFQQKSRTKYYIFTLEGFSYEQYITDELRKINQKSRFIFYQHSPIVPGHAGVKNFLHQCNVPLDILVTGKFYMRYFQEISSVPRYLLLGSQKTFSSISLKNNVKRSAVLFTPEGTISATLEFTKLIKNLLESDSHRIFVLRLHPNLQTSLRISLIVKRLQQYKNFKISNGELQSELNNSEFVFYRSSAVGVESLMSGATPVFYAQPTQADLNPLKLISKNTKTVYNFRQANQILNSRKNDIDFVDKNMISEALFTKINYRVLHDIFNHPIN
jgi:hypothetical protein